MPEGALTDLQIPQDQIIHLFLHRTVRFHWRKLFQEDASNRLFCEFLPRTFTVLGCAAYAVV